MNTIKTSLTGLVLAVLAANANAAYVLYEGSQVNYYIDTSHFYSSPFEFSVTGNNLRIERKGDNPLAAATAVRYGGDGQQFILNEVAPNMPIIYAQTKTGSTFYSFDIAHSEFVNGLDAGEAFGYRQIATSLNVVGYNSDTHVYDHQNEVVLETGSFEQLASNGNGVYAENDFIYIEAESKDLRPKALRNPTNSVSLHPFANTALSFTSTSHFGWTTTGIDSITLKPGLVAPVPEPETYALMGMGLLGLIAARSRKKRKAA